MRSATRKKAGKDKLYLRWLHTLPCVVCIALLAVQVTPTEAAHVGERGLSQKAPDSTAIPLCVMHHREGKDAAHKLGRKFFEHHGIDRDDLIAKLHQQYKTEAA